MHTSTLAFSLYNVLVMNGGSLEVRLAVDSLRLAIRGTEFGDVDVIDAINGLKSRGYITQEVIDADGEKRTLIQAVVPRIVRKRDRTGDGWNGWSFGDQLLDEVIRCSHE